MSNTTSFIPVTQASTGCVCGETEESPEPVLDARVIPHAIRHAAIFGALDSLDAGSAMVLIAPHNPAALLKQAEDRYGGTISVSYLKQDPDECHVRLERTAG